MSVNPHGAEHIDAIELYAVALVPVESFHVEGLPVPTHARREEANASTARVFAQVIAFYTPVMGHVKPSPVHTIVSGSLSTHDITLMKPPTGVHVSHSAGLSHGGCKNEQ